MPANIGEMFYYGEIPWHGLGNKVECPLNVEEALEAGRLNWEVECVPLQTAELPPSPVNMRMAIARKDRKYGDPQRVLGVAHKQFKPLQNRLGAKIFDAVFGKEKPVYHTGGYLGNGEVVWLLAKLPADMQITEGDTVKPYALFTNSHNGSIAIDVRLTTVRVVCQNTLSFALSKRLNSDFFKHAHQGDYSNLQQEIEGVFSTTLEAIRNLETAFTQMLQTQFPSDAMDEYVKELYPFPKEISANSPAFSLYKYRLERAQDARKTITELRQSGKGTDMPGISGSLWGALNAVLEYVDHYQDGASSSLAEGLFGQKAAKKKKAFDLSLPHLPEQLRLF